MPYKNRRRQLAFQRRLYRERRAAWIAANGPCKRCARTCQLEVDHIDPATKISHAVWLWAKERRETELAKCQVLCRYCHDLKTADEIRARRGSAA